MNDRDRNQDMPIVPVGPVIGAPVLTPGLVGDELFDEHEGGVVAAEQDRDAFEEELNAL